MSVQREVIAPWIDSSNKAEAEKQAAELLKISKEQPDNLAKELEKIKDKPEIKSEILRNLEKSIISMDYMKDVVANKDGIKDQLNLYCKMKWLSVNGQENTQELFELAAKEINKGSKEAPKSYTLWSALPENEKTSREKDLSNQLEKTNKASDLLQKLKNAKDLSSIDDKTKLELMNKTDFSKWDLKVVAELIWKDPWFSLLKKQIIKWASIENAKIIEEWLVLFQKNIENAFMNMEKNWISIENNDDLTLIENLWWEKWKEAVKQFKSWEVKDKFEWKKCFIYKNWEISPLSSNWILDNITTSFDISKINTTDIKAISKELAAGNNNLLINFEEALNSLPWNSIIKQFLEFISILFWFKKVEKKEELDKWDKIKLIDKILNDKEDKWYKIDDIKFDKWDLKDSDKEWQQKYIKDVQKLIWINEKDKSWKTFEYWDKTKSAVEKIQKLVWMKENEIKEKKWIMDADLLKKYKEYLEKPEEKKSEPPEKPETKTDSTPIKTEAKPTETKTEITQDKKDATPESKKEWNFKVWEKVKTIKAWINIRNNESDWYSPIRKTKANETFTVVNDGIGNTTMVTDDKKEHNMIPVKIWKDEKIYYIAEEYLRSAEWWSTKKETKKWSKSSKWKRNN